MNYTPIGRVRPIHKGAHDPSAAYAALDVVRREDGFASYMAKRDVPAGTPLADGAYWGLLSDGGLKAVADASCPAFEETGSAAVCHPVAGYPLEVATLIAPKQAGAGAPSPDNIRPISGWTGAGLTRCGKNLLNLSAIPDIKDRDYSFDPISGVYRIASLPANIANRWVVKVPSNTDMCMHVDAITDNGIVEVGLFLQGDATTAFCILTSGAKTAVFNTGNHTEITISIYTSAETELVINGAQLEKGSTATTYAPYQGDTYAADFGQTVYGGTLDWQTGVLTVEWAGKNIPYSRSWIGIEQIGDYTRAILDNGVDAHAEPYIDGSRNGMCSHMEYISNWHGEYNHIYANYNQVIIIMSSSIVGTSSDGINAYLAAQYAAGTPVQIAYKLATPTTIQLTAQEILALDGLNTLISDCGGTRAAGRSDITWVTQGILDRLAALEAAAVSD